MRYKLLGNTGLRVSEVCLGTMTFGEDWGWGSPKETSKEIYDAFLEAGGNFIDTANIYTNGSSEKLLGEFLGSERDRIVLATKYTIANAGTDPNAAGNHRKSMMRSVEASLKRLKTDYIDLYWLHIWDFLTPVEEVLRGLDDLVRAGKILHAGISDTPAWVVSRANTIAEFRGWTPFAGIQVEYSLVERTPERELLPMARELGVGITAWSPLGAGLLTGKYAKNATAAEPKRLDDPSSRDFQRLDDRKHSIVDAVVALARETGHSPAQVALNWVRQQPGSPISILGARRLSQLQDNLASLEWKLTDDQIARLSEASKIELGFPHDFYEKEIPRSFTFGGMRDRIDGRR